MRDPCVTHAVSPLRSPQRVWQLFKSHDGEDKFRRLLREALASGALATKVGLLKQPSKAAKG